MHFRNAVVGLVVTSVVVASPFRPPPTADQNPACAHGTAPCFGPGPILPRSDPYEHTLRGELSTTESDREKPKHEKMIFTSLSDVPLDSFELPSASERRGASSQKSAPRISRDLEHMKDTSRLERRVKQDGQAQQVQRALDQVDGYLSGDEGKKTQNLTKIALDGANNPRSETGEPATAIHRNILELNKHNADPEALQKEQLTRRHLLEDRYERHPRLDHREKATGAKSETATHIREEINTPSESVGTSHAPVNNGHTLQRPS
ncbi:MAG: hypothetical protein Q9191_002085 [Dirinaria sp. TL-2023a]